MAEAKTLIIAHGDCDGVTSAALALSIYAGKVVFSHPVGILEDLDEFSEDADRIVILDIALDERHWRQLAERLAGYWEAIYVDHHPPPEGSLEFLREKGVKVNHEENACTAELTFRYLKPRAELSRVARIRKE